jgi:hypothetical protein
MNREDVIRGIHEKYLQSGGVLNELQRRQWAAVEAMRLGRGGITIVSLALQISPTTIRRGIREISAGQSRSVANATARIRKPGGGRKPSRPPAELSPGCEQGHVPAGDDGGLVMRERLNGVLPGQTASKPRPESDTALD